MSKIAIMCHCISSGRDTVGGIARTGASVVAERHATGRWRLRGQEQSVLDGHRDHVHERRAVRQLQARPAAALLVTAVEQVPTPRLHQHHARIRQNGHRSHVATRQALRLAVGRRKSRLVQQRVSRITCRCGSRQSSFGYSHFDHASLCL